MEKDHFIQKLREDGELLSSFRAFVKEYRGTVLESIIGRNDEKDLLRAQGAVRGLDLFETRVLHAVHPPTRNNHGVGGGADGDESRTRTNGSNVP